MPCGKYRHAPWFVRETTHRSSMAGFVPWNVLRGMYHGLPMGHAVQFAVFFMEILGDTLDNVNRGCVYQRWPIIM